MYTYKWMEAYSSLCECISRHDVVGVYQLVFSYLQTIKHINIFDGVCWNTEKCELSERIRELSAYSAHIHGQ